MRTLLWVFVAFSRLVQTCVYLFLFGWVIWMVVDAGPVGLLAIFPAMAAGVIFGLVWYVLMIPFIALFAGYFERHPD